MFCYKENRFVSQTHGKREDAGAQWIDTHPAGISAQLEFSCTLIALRIQRMPQRGAHLAVCDGC